MTAAQRERVRRMSERALIRSWEYRQRAYAKGVWFRLRRVLVDAARAFAISEIDADRLEENGQRPLLVGRELSPAKRIFFVSEVQLRGIEAQELPVRLTELLRCSALALLAHEPGGAGARHDTGAPATCGGEPEVGPE